MHRTYTYKAVQNLLHTYYSSSAFTAGPEEHCGYSDGGGSTSTHLAEINPRTGVDLVAHPHTTRQAVRRALCGPTPLPWARGHATVWRHCPAIENENCNDAKWRCATPTATGVARDSAVSLFILKMYFGA